MTAFEDIRELYRAYIEKAEQLEHDRKPGEGLFGLGKKPADDPCHDKFAEDIDKALRAYSEGSHDSSEVKDVLEFVYSAPVEHKEPISIFWMLTAVHGSTLALIPLLSPADAATLHKQYGKLFRRWERLPVQQEVFKALGGAAKR